LAHKQFAIRQLRNLTVLFLVSLFGVAFSHQQNPPWIDPPTPTALDVDHPWYEGGRFVRRSVAEAATSLAPQARETALLRLGHELIDITEAASEAIRKFEEERVPPVRLVRISSRFGMRMHPVLKQRRMHNGVDFAAPRGTPIRAVADGVVTFSGWSGGAGKLVKIKHDDFESGYAHLATISRDIRPGSEVKAGDYLGGVGASGLATGNHLHFTIRMGGRFVDPMKDGLDRIEPMEGLEVIAGLERNLGRVFSAIQVSAFEWLELSEVESETDFSAFLDDSFL